MSERNGVRLGQRVRDLDGRALGRVTHLYDWGFAVRKGLPFLIRSDLVARYDEVRAVRDGALVLARSSRDLHELAAGELPASWRVPVPPSYPTAATPSEGALLRADLARGAVSTELEPERVDRAPGTVAPPSGDEARAYREPRGQAAPPVR